MKIAVLSGKGGTGKTLVTVNLAAASDKAAYLDCDVEEPNGHLFFKPVNQTTEEVSVTVPSFDGSLCTGCHECIKFCRFNALAGVGSNVLVFEEICHSCGGCLWVCPTKALTEKKKAIGEIQCGQSGNVTVITGRMNVGEASGVPVIKKVLGYSRDMEKMVLIDCPPGSACLVMESVKDVDYCLLVAEPTLFGRHNLEMVHRLVRLFNKPHGVVLNKCMGAENPSLRYCEEQNIKILGSIPFDQELGLLNAHATIAVREKDTYKAVFSNLLTAIKEEVRLL